MNTASLLFSAIIVPGALFAAEPVISNATREIWTDQCRKCHGAEGDAQTTMGKKVGAYNFQDPATQAKFTDEQAFKSIKEGKRDSEGKRKMRAAEDLKDEQIRELIRLVRSFRKTEDAAAAR
jgi:cytochrome c553